MKPTIEQIIATHRAKIFRICLGYAARPSDAYDLAQEVFINIWRGLPQLKNAQYLQTWIYRIAVNTCLLHLRKKSVPTTSIEDWMADKLPQPNNGRSDNEQLLKLRQLIQQLPEKDRLIILLYLEGFSQQEIAEIAGIKANYVGVKINRIKKLFIKKIKTL